MELGELISLYRKQKNLTIDELAQLSGVPKGTINKIIGGVTKAPTLENVRAIAYALGKTLNDFDDNPHSVKKETPSDLPEEALKIAKDYTALSDHGKGAVKAILEFEIKDAAIKDVPVKVEVSPAPKMPKAKRNGYGFIEIRVYDQPAAAGLGNYLDDPDFHIEQYPADVIPSKTDFGILISGDSMEPKIHDGSTAFVQASLSINPGQIGIFILNGEAYCKKLAVDHEKRSIRLVSLNDKYDDIVIRTDDEFRTVGLVIGQWTPRRFN